jgi:tartrate-resistant acid phosphatase type 5
MYLSSFKWCADCEETMTRTAYSRPSKEGGAGELAVVGLLIASYLYTFSAWAQAPPHMDGVPLDDEILRRLPEDWRSPVLNYLKVSTKDRNAKLLALSDGEMRTSILTSLSFDEGAEEFVIDHLAEAVPNRELLILVLNIPSQNHWRGHPRIEDELKAMVASAPDHEIAVTCLNSVRKLEMQRLRDVLKKRIEVRRATATVSEVEVAKLQDLDEHWISVVEGTMLPDFLRRPPPVLVVQEGASRVRVLAIGDFGARELKEEWNNQQGTALGIRRYARAHPLDLGITLGDNFYPEGMASPDQGRWLNDWEAMYGPLGIRFYATLGNHDWEGTDSPAAEILRSRLSSTWYMPSPYYTFTAGPAQFFATDSNEISAAQQAWLKDALEHSRAKWKVVFGHFPPYFAGRNGDTSDERVVRELMPILKGRADVYIAGHHHSLQHLRPVDGVNLFIAGGGGAATHEVDSKSAVALFARQTNGFAIMEIDDRSLTVHLVDADGEDLHTTILKK